MRRTAALICLILAASLASGQDAIKIAKEHVVANTDKDGVCWFCCAAMIGNHANIVTLQGLDQKVLKSGIGHKTGATEESIQHWLKEAGVKALSNPAGEKGKEAVERIQGWLDKGLPVIASYKHSTGGHAILLTRISRAKEKWKTDKGEDIEDYAVVYVDPDDQKTWRVTWTWFYEAWTGKAYAFDPKDQDPRIVAQPELRPGRLLLSTGKFVPTKKVIDPVLLERTKHVSPPIETRYESPPYLPHNLPYEAKYPAFNEKIKIPSNQDIKDGVTRPLDFFRNNCYGYFDHDYHSEYEAFKAKKKTP